MAMAIPIFHYLSLLLLLVLLLPLMAVSQTVNISLGTSLIASENSSPWQSPSKDFAFGFHRIENQNLYLLAIWFQKIPEKTLVWYANGDKPAPEGSKVELTRDGRFTLTDPQGGELWKPESVVNGIAYTAMLDEGNFVLADNDSKYVWESFNDPRDTMLPTQILEVGGILSSRRTESNYSKGRFQVKLKPNGNLELCLIALPTNTEYDSYQISINNDSADALNSDFKLVFNESGYLHVERGNGKIDNLTTGNLPSATKFYYRVTLDVDGVFTQYAHPRAIENGSSDGSWSIVWYTPGDICNEIIGDLGGGPCRFNSICTPDMDGRPTCECLPGFSLSDPVDKFSGCKQDRVQKCDPGAPNPEEQYDMQIKSNIVWVGTANFEELSPFDEDACRRACMNDCNCLVAVAYSGSCWKKKFPLSSGRVDRSRYAKAFIKIPKSNDSLGQPLSPNSDMKDKDQDTLILVLSLISGSSVFLNFLLIAAGSIAVFFTYYKKQKLNERSSILETNLRTFTFEDLKKATDGFREELGRGAFGTVYKGVLSSSSISRILVAVKKLDKVLREGEKEFITEASTIAKTHHRNLVRLLGFCDDGPHKLLVYEYMSNGTLASFLFGISRPDWKKRTQMAFEIARGIMYLHEDCSTQIIHCDIKPQNILLDDSFTARISDFGLAKLLMSGQTRTLTGIRGTKGYVAPEWFRNTPITAKVDVYSYGVMLLEIICCRKSLEMERENEEEVILTDWVYDCYKERKLDKLVEFDEEARNDRKRLERLVMVAIWCIQEDTSLRPTMKMVTQMLEGVVQVSVPPCPSPFSSIC